MSAMKLQMCQRGAIPVNYTVIDHRSCQPMRASDIFLCSADCQVDRHICDVDT